MSFVDSVSGALQKMQASPLHNSSSVVHYHLCVGEHKIPLDDFLGKFIKIEFAGDIYCRSCSAKTPKSYGQGYCYSCFKSLPECDICIVSPEKCHYLNGTCRDSAWGERFCMTDHVVYLANSSGLKVGITRVNQIPTRWIDQGAVQAIPMFRVSTRQQSGLIEDSLKAYVADKTNWRAMLQGDAQPVDLIAERNLLFSNTYKIVAKLQALFGIQAIQPIENETVTELCYPIKRYPTKIISHNLDKQLLVEGTLEGIKGQYLLLDTGVINIRKYTAYQVNVSIHA